MSLVECNPPYKTSNRTNILNIPDEILVKIILQLNARERVPLGNSCQRFHRLIFEDKELLRNLDFSKDGGLTSASDIQQYFKNEITCELILRVNVRNVKCIKSGSMLDNSIKKAINLIDINIHGISHEENWQLTSFLNRLVHVQRLSFDWQPNDTSSINRNIILEKPFSKLTHLSVYIHLENLEEFVFSLQFCQELKKLAIEGCFVGRYHEIANTQLRKLQKLQILEYFGPSAIQIKERLVTMLPDPETWTDFQLCCLTYPSGFYLEKDVEVCEELAGSKWMKSFPSAEWKDLSLGWALFPELLLKGVLEITHENFPDKLCCLTTFTNGGRCLLKIEEAKRLLKDPTYEISYLYLNHRIERNCDIHFIASAFPNLTELHLHSVSCSKTETHSETSSPQRLRRRGSTTSEQQDNQQNIGSSFRILVKNTPNVRHLTLNLGSDMDRDSQWDLEALHLISDWKNLKTLRLRKIPIKDGEFLIEIGKHCRQLQKLELMHLGPSYACCFKEQLLRMLPLCQDLREFSIAQYHIGQVSEVFTSLANNKKLQKVRAKSLRDSNSTANLISSIDLLLRACPELTTFVCEIDNTSEPDHEELVLTVQRLKSELNRSNLQLQVICHQRRATTQNIGSFYEDTPLPHPFPHISTAK